MIKISGTPYFDTKFCIELFIEENLVTSYSIKLKDTFSKLSYHLQNLNLKNEPLTFSSRKLLTILFPIVPLPPKTKAFFPTSENLSIIFIFPLNTLLIQSQNFRQYQLILTGASHKWMYIFEIRSSG